MTSKRMVHVLVLPGGAGPLRVEEIDADDYRDLNRLVGGNLGTCGLPPELREQHFYAFCDDNGLIRQDRPAENRFAHHLGHSKLVGPIVIVKTDELGETEGLEPQDMRTLTKYLSSPPTDEARRMVANEEAFYEAHPSGIAVWTPETGWEDLP